MSTRFELIDEFRISPDQREAIRKLLQACFPNEQFPNTRTYLKQLPQRRLMAWEGDALVGQMGIEHRMIGLATGPATVFGVIDFCVDPQHRRRGMASEMLARLERLGKEHGVEFVILFAHDTRLYERSGYRRPNSPLRWLKIHEHQSIGIGEEVLPELMIKEIGSRAWPAGLVDLLGYQF